MKPIFYHWRTVLGCSWLCLSWLCLSACDGAQSQATATEVSIVLTETAVPTNTLPPSATNTVVPSQTAAPTATATATAVPTNTPLPSPTPLPSATATLSAPVTATNPPLPTNTGPPPATLTPTVARLTIGSLAESMGQKITVSGTVVNASSFAGGFRFTLSDDTGRVTLLMWHNVYDECLDAPELNRAAMVEVTGIIGTFEGELQIVPDFGQDVQVTAVGAAFAPDRNIGELADYLGELVQITGQIIRIESTNSGSKLFVGDDTGEVPVFVWNNVLARVPNNVALGVPGTQVRVVGTVQEFESNREVVPALPYDIEVLP